MNKECWKEIPDFYGLYFVSSLGRIKSKQRKTERLLKYRKDKDGYLRCNVSIYGVHKTLLVHRLVANAFLPVKKANQMVDHINRVKTDNRAVNLRYASASENSLNRKYKKESKYIGVYRRKNTKQGASWSAGVCRNNKFIYIGTYSKEKDAALAFDTFCIANKLDRQLNFN